MRTGLAGLASAGAVSVLVLAGCGAGADGTVDAGGGQGATAAFLSGAASRTAEARTGRFHLTVAVSGGGSASAGAGTTMTADGAFDRDADRSTITVQPWAGAPADPGTSPGGSSSWADALTGPETMVTVGDTLYVRGGFVSLLGDTSAPWVRIDGAAGGGSATSSDPGGVAGLMGSGVDAEHQLAELESVSGGVTVVGHDVLDGIDTIHYRATVDLAKAASHAGSGGSADSSSDPSTGTVPPDPGAELGEPSGTVPVEVWVGSDGLVRRYSTVVDAASLRFGGGWLGVPGADAPTFTSTFDLTDLGAPVDVQVPPPDQVTTLDLQHLASRGSAAWAAWAAWVARPGRADRDGVAPAGPGRRGRAGHRRGRRGRPTPAVGARLHGCGLRLRRGPRAAGRVGLARGRPRPARSRREQQARGLRTRTRSTSSRPTSSGWPMRSGSIASRCSGTPWGA